MNYHKLPVEGEGFIRITKDEFKNKITSIMMLVSMEKLRYLLHKDGRDIAALIPLEEFEKLNNLLSYIKPSQYLPEDEEFYEDDIAIHGIYCDEFLEDFEEIIEAAFYEECFGLLPSQDMEKIDKNIDIFMPIAILISAHWFWIPEYYIAEHQERQ